MNFEEFKEKIAGSILAYLPDKYQEGNVEMSQVDRINEGHTALMVKTEGENIYASINLDQFYEGYAAGEMTFGDVIGEISNQIQQEVPPGLDTDFLSNYEKAKDVLFIRVCGAEQNQELLETVPHKTVEDLALTYHLLVSKGDELIGSAMVTNAHMEVYGVTPEQLHQDALENSPKLFPMQILTIRDVLTENIRQEMEAEGMPKELQDVILGSMYPEGAATSYVITNDNRFNGAGALFYPGVMEEIAEKIGKDYIVLPSSTHDMIIIPDDGAVSSHVMELMVADANQEAVEPKDRLTDNAYHYDRKDHVFERFSTFEERMAEKVKAVARSEQERHPSSPAPKRESVLKRLDEKKSIVKAREEGRAKTAVKEKKKDQTLA